MKKMNIEHRTFNIERRMKNKKMNIEHRTSLRAGGQHSPNEIEKKKAFHGVKILNG
jgi:hypothetical protein